MSDTVSVHGPLFDGRLAIVVKGAVEEAKLAVAHQGQVEVRTALYRVVKHGSGHYGSQLQVDRTMGDPRVTDGGSVYGPWLAGTGGRNHKSRFKGYHHWRQAAQRLERKADDIASRIINRRLGGSA